MLHGSTVCGLSLCDIRLNHCGGHSYSLVLDRRSIGKLAGKWVVLLKGVQ